MISTLKSYVITACFWSVRVDLIANLQMGTFGSSLIFFFFFFFHMASVRCPESCTSLVCCWTTSVNLTSPVNLNLTLKYLIIIGCPIMTPSTSNLQSNEYLYEAITLFSRQIKLSWRSKLIHYIDTRKYHTP